jgi:hypothetical protein
MEKNLIVVNIRKGPYNSDIIWDLRELLGYLLLETISSQASFYIERRRFNDYRKHRHRSNPYVVEQVEYSQAIG